MSDAFKDFIKRSNYGFSQWRSFMVGNKSYAFKHVLNFNLESKGLFIDFMKSLKECNYSARSKLLNFLMLTF
ncbi:hypothetical protein HPSNT_00310 [Helicobacter pylori SNT49]|uniref:Uncharacterized protein n=1 Tax=Helicobacter pylori SNT49 TaxID=1055530 RepID=G2MCX3_HELPX|nr:hypothetical protein HPSNT_00310 [Helicobacter pylori SNT49]